MSMYGGKTAVAFVSMASVVVGLIGNEAQAISMREIFRRRCSIEFEKHGCSGFLLGDNRVMTAKHCLQGVEYQPKVVCGGYETVGTHVGAYKNDVGFLILGSSIPVSEKLNFIGTSEVSKDDVFVMISMFPEYTSTIGQVTEVKTEKIDLKASKGVFCKGNSGSPIFIASGDDYRFYGVLSKIGVYPGNDCGFFGYADEWVPY